MTGNLQNISFRYLKLDGGSSSIDSSMTDRKFYSSKPVGYYRVFTFTHSFFAGIDHDDLQNLVSSEMKDVWDKNNRDTYLGYNLQDKRFILNINAYLGLKDSDLKTDGEMPHSGQAGWHSMELTSAKADAIITLKQIDGTDIYLKIEEPSLAESLGNRIVVSTCVEAVSKDVAETTIFKKHSCLFVKSPEDNSVVMIFDNVKETRSNKDKFDLDKKLFFGDDSQTPPLHTQQIFLYGKPVMYYPDTGTSSTVAKSPTTRSGYIKNSTGKTHYKLTETSNLGDIINTGESVSFFMVPKSKRAVHYGYVYFNDPSGRKFYKNLPAVSTYANRLEFSNMRFPGRNVRFYANAKPHEIGIDCDLRSYDPRKPFVYIAPKGGVKMISPYIGLQDVLGIDTTNFLNNLPDGYIAFYYAGVGQTQYVFRHTNAGVKRIPITPIGRTLSVNPDIPTAFFEKLYDEKGALIPDHKLTRDQAENGTGFTDVPSDDTYYVNYNDFIVTIMRV